MTDIAKTNELFFARTGMNQAHVSRITEDALSGADDGELFLEYTQSEGVTFDDGRVKSASFDTTQGFGLRAVSGEATGYAHSSELTEVAIRRAADTVKAVRTGRAAILAQAPAGTNQTLYPDINPLGEMAFADKVQLLADVDTYARGRDTRVKQVSASLTGEWQAVQILRGDGQRAADIRPLVGLRVNVVVEQNGHMETGGHGAGGRAAYDYWVQPENWRAQVDEALRMALVNL